MELYIINFYDNNESGNEEHGEMYSTKRAAERRFNFLKSHLNGYSWVKLWDTYTEKGRVRYGCVIDRCDSCEGDDDWCHGDDDDF